MSIQDDDRRKFYDWYCLQSKSPYRSTHECMEMAWFAGRYSLEKELAAMTAERDALRAKLDFKATEKITLTANEVYEVAVFLDIPVGECRPDEKDTLVTIVADVMAVKDEGENKLRFPKFCYLTEYPEEGANPIGELLAIDAATQTIKEVSK